MSPELAAAVDVTNLSEQAIAEYGKLEAAHLSPEPFEHQGREYNHPHLMGVTSIKNIGTIAVSIWERAGPPSPKFDAHDYLVRTSDGTQMTTRDIVMGYWRMLDGLEERRLVTRYDPDSSSLWGNEYVWVILHYGNDIYRTREGEGQLTVIQHPEEIFVPDQRSGRELVAKLA